jgi:DNA-directed RNA polymerase subunit RPC12/RpoP
MDAEGWLTSELASFGCAACGQPYGEGHVRLIAQREEIFFLDLTCPHCGSQAVAIVTIQADGEADGSADHHVEARGVVRSAEDGSRSVVSVDDVIDAHVLLRDFEGDVHQLIARFDGERS